VTPDGRCLVGIGEPTPLGLSESNICIRIGLLEDTNCVGLEETGRIVEEDGLFVIFIPFGVDVGFIFIVIILGFIFIVGFVPMVIGCAGRCSCFAKCRKNKDPWISGKGLGIARLPVVGGARGIVPVLFRLCFCIFHFLRLRRLACFRMDER
jgi:hypothetical protein